jgi:DNA-directed RNA polymerase specialized sigma subunit
VKDLIQEGMFGLIKAVREFDVNKDILFKNYAGCVYGAALFPQ